jgi:hypothetical protein
MLKWISCDCDFLGPKADLKDGTPAMQSMRWFINLKRHEAVGRGIPANTIFCPDPDKI